MPVGIVLVAVELGKVAYALGSVLIGNLHVVDTLLYLGLIFLFLGAEIMEPLVELYPEDVATELASLQMEVVRPRLVDKRAFVDRHLAAGHLPVVVEQVPRTFHGVEILLRTRGTIEVEVWLYGREQIVVGTIVGIFVDNLRVALRKAFHEIVLLEITHDHLQVFGLPDR